VFGDLVESQVQFLHRGKLSTLPMAIRLIEDLRRLGVGQTTARSDEQSDSALEVHPILLTGHLNADEALVDVLLQGCS